MDQKFLKRLISECPLTDFSQNENVTERELQLDKYLEQFTSFLYANENQLIQLFWQEYIASSEFALLQNSQMLRRCFIFLDCAVAIYNYTARKSRGKKNSQIAEHVSVQLQNDLNQYKSILLLAMNGCFNSVIVEYRSLYESFVIGQYLVQNPDLVPVYKDHLQFLKYHLTQFVGNSKPEWDKIHDNYLNKYGQEFAENYGWTKNKIQNKKDRKIGTLVKACNLEKSFTILYKFACSYVHSSAFSVSTRTDLDQIKVFFQVAMHIIESEITDYMRESRLTTKDAVVMRNILIFLNQDFEKLEQRKSPRRLDCGNLAERPRF
ncbi:MAG: hypothetical protein IJP90_06510 [Treponema sp.]|nr:hypothetical protein [Treponema sp.]